MTDLKLAPKLSLPIDAVTQRQAFLGKPGSGKSYAAMKEAELMYDAGAQFVALDPVGVWYGLRLDGKGKGLPIPVFGGLHGDVPLEPTSGAMIADLVVDRRLTCVLDISQFEHDTDKARFSSAFAQRFYFRMKAAPAAVHIFLEECQETVPQNPQRGEEQMLHHWVRMDKLGRNFGIGMSLISQRPQEINKKALNLTECLFAFQMTGAHERKAIKEWVQAVGADENILDILPTLAVAHAHVYSPQWLRISETVKIGEKRTADVSSTPAVGVSAAQSKPLAKVDLEQIREQMAATIEKAKAEDPKELRKEIASLKRQLATPTRNGETIVPHKVMTSQIDAAVTVARNQAHALATKDAERAIQKVRADERQRYDRLETAAKRLLKYAQGIATDAGLMVQTYTDALARNAVEPLPVTPPPLSKNPAQARHLERLVVTPAARRDPTLDGKIGKTGAKILGALAFYESIGKTSVDSSWVAAFVGMTASGGSWGARLSELRQGGYIVGSGTLELTDAGRAIADTSGNPRSLAELHDQWRAKLGGKARAMLDVVLEAYPNGVTKEELAAAVEMEMAGGSFGARLSEVRAPGLLDDKAPRGTVRASDVLFPDGLA